MPGPGGRDFQQSYNFQAVVDSAHQVTVAARATNLGSDKGQAVPMVGEAIANLGTAPREVSADARYYWAQAVEDSTGSEKDLSPYWSDYTRAISSALWLPTGTGWPDSDSRSSNGWPSATVGNSWFSTTGTTAPPRNSSRIYSPSFTPSAAGCMDSAATGRLSRRIRVSRAAAKHTTVAERKCTTGVMPEGADLGVGVATGTVVGGPWEDYGPACSGAEDSVAFCRLPLRR